MFKRGIDFAASRGKKPLNLHRIVKGDAPNLDEVGRLRTRQNWIGPEGCSINEAYFYPPEARKVKKYMLDPGVYARGRERDPMEM